MRRSPIRTARRSDERGRRWGRACLLLLPLLAACPTLPSGEAESGLRRGAVACEHPLATSVGLDVLERGGNAADAAVAVALALAVVYPEAGNLGGGGFAIWVPAEGEPRALDFRETAPTGASGELYVDEQGEVVPARSRVGPLSVGVPGSPAGLHALWAECGSGKLAFAELVAPALSLAREGFAVDPWLAHTLRLDGVFEKMNAPARAIFYPDGVPLREGQQLVQEALARTLAHYGEHGPAAFYRGSLASALLRELDGMSAPGMGVPATGVVSAADLAAYAHVWRAPLRGWFRGRELITMPPPSSGGLVILQALAILEGLPLESERDAALAAGDEDGLAERGLHWWIEALRYSFADRAMHMGDPDYHDVPIDELLSSEWIATRRISIGARARPEIAPWIPPPPPESDQTTHLSVVDQSGNAVSLTTTLNGWFGSGILVRDGGYFLNNEMDDFAVRWGVANQFGLIGGEANRIEEGKRPLSSMSPTVVRGPDGRVRVVLGSPGGPRIITGVIQVLLRLIVLEQDIASAVSAPRIHQQWSPQETWFEAGFGEGWEDELIGSLEKRGHPVLRVDRRLASVQAIRIDDRGVPHPFSDPRRGGAAGVEGGEVSEPARP